jgi:phosphatidylserine decarboxylase
VRIDPAGWPFVGAAIVAGALGALFLSTVLGLAFLILAGIFLFFFRDPDRVPTQAPGAVLAPADGRVLIAGIFRPITGSR